jgi:hypothetical protein
MDSTNFPSCCNARILHDFTEDYDDVKVSARTIKSRLNSLKRVNNIVVAITSDHQDMNAKMTAGGFKKVGDARRHPGFITLWAWLNPMPKKTKKTATKRARR